MTGLATTPAVGDAQDRIVDAAVERLEEMLRAELELDVLDQPVVDHQRAKQRGLGLDILGKRGGRGRFGALVEFGQFRPWIFLGLVLARITKRERNRHVCG